MKKAITLLVGALLLLGGATPAPASLRQYLAEARAHNDELAAARAEAQASREGVRQAGVLPDPVLGLEYYVESVETRTGPQEAAVSLSQRLPWPTKLSLQKQEVRQQSAMADSRLQEVALLVERRVKEAYVEYAFNNEALAIAVEGALLLGYFESVALTSYSAGRLDYSSVLQIQVEQARLEERRRSLADQNGPLQGRLNALLGAPRDTARSLPLRLPVITLNQKAAGLYEVARAQSPKLAGVAAAVHKAKTSRAMAEKDFYPDLALSLKTIVTGAAEYGDPPDSGRNPVIAGISMNIPLFRDRRHGAVAARQEEVRAAQGQQGQERRDLDAAIDQGLYRYRDAVQRQTLYRESIIPRIRQQVEVGLQAFEGGNQTVFALLEAEKNLLEFQLSQRQALADQALEVARLEELVGITLAQWDHATADTEAADRGQPPALNEAGLP
ncbi:MAG: TolC family protein [Desulfurivibrionaceae bacterium]|nr:TolC family protein [Desulfurivibrionaceae bacterium]